MVLALSSLALAGKYGPGPRENIVDSYNNDGEYMNVLNEERYGPGPYGHGGPRPIYGAGPRPAPYGVPSYGGPSYEHVPSYGPSYGPSYAPSYDRDINTNRNANRDANANANANRDGKFSL